MSGYEDLARLATIRPLTRPMKLGGRFSPFKAGWPSTVNLLVKELRAHGARNVVLEVDFREQDLRLDWIPPEHPAPAVKTQQSNLTPPARPPSREP